MNYETKYFNKDQLIDLSYDVPMALNKYRREFNIIDEKEENYLNKILVVSKKLVNYVEHYEKMGKINQTIKLKKYYSKNGTINLKKDLSPAALKKSSGLLGLVSSGIKFATYIIRNKI